MRHKGAFFLKISIKNIEFGLFFLWRTFPPSVPAFLLVVPPHKKSSTQVGAQGRSSVQIKIKYKNAFENSNILIQKKYPSLVRASRSYLQFFGYERDARTSEGKNQFTGFSSSSSSFSIQSCDWKFMLS